MNASFLKRWTAWLLPLLVLRAFIPVGFMLSSGPQGLQLMFCPGVMQASGGHPAAADHGASSADGSGHGNQHGDSHEQHEQSPCPYGLVSAAAWVEPHLALLRGITTDEAISLPPISPLDRSPATAEPIRGPPLTSLEALI
jgi:hypothetical protein